MKKSLFDEFPKSDFIGLSTPIEFDRDRAEKLNQLFDKALDYLESVVDDENERTALRIRAAELIGRWNNYR